MITVYYDGTVYSTPDTPPPLMDGLNRGNSKSTGTWGKGAKQKFTSRCAYMVDTCRFNDIVFVLTYRKGHGGEKYFKRHIDNFTRWLKHRGVQAFAYTIELTPRGTIHSHWIVNSQYFNVTDLNNAWSHIRGDYSKNAVTGLEKLKDIESLSAYYSKAAKASAYASKAARDSLACQDKLKTIRLWGTSRNLVGTEKITIHDENQQIATLRNCENWQTIQLNDTVQILKSRMNREGVDEVWRMHETFKRQTQEKQSKPPQTKKESSRQQRIQL